MLKRFFSSVESGPSTSVKASGSSPSPSPAPPAAKKAKRATPAAPYPLPNAPNDPPFCPRHDYYPPSAAHIQKYGHPPCGEGCVASEDAELEQDSDADAVEQEAPRDKGKGRALKVEEEDEVIDFEVVEAPPLRQATPRRAPSPPPVPALAAAAPAPAPAAPILPEPQPVPAWINGDHFFARVPAVRAIRKQFGGWSWRNTGGRKLVPSGHRLTTYRCSGHIVCSSCGNKTRTQSSLTRIRAQCLKSCSMCADEPGTLYRVDCLARARRTTTAEVGVVQIEFEGEHQCSHVYGGGQMVKRNPDDDDEPRVNVGALAAKKQGPLDFMWKGGGAEFHFKQKYEGGQ
ncbi:hypothetical protein RQP46_010974 [Phenoliferia psychrophenolica]